MSDLAFNNYCIICDQLCVSSSIYCSDACKRTDEQHRPEVIDSDELVSPLLAPSLYHTESRELNELDSFDLNYSVVSNGSFPKIDYGEPCGVSSTLSHNYRKWLTACL